MLTLVHQALDLLCLLTTSLPCLAFTWAQESKSRSSHLPGKDFIHQAFSPSQLSLSQSNKNPGPIGGGGDKWHTVAVSGVV